MIEFHKLILASIALLCLVKCNYKQDKKNAIQFFVSPVDTQISEHLIGEWRYYFPWYSSELVLQEDGNFTFHDQGCFGQRFSQGYWATENNIIQLTSFEEFKQREQDGNNILNDTHLQKTIGSSKELNVEYNSIILNKVPPPVLPGPNDTIRVYFEQVRLQLANDTLYCIGTNRLPEHAKFYKVIDSL